MLKYRMSDGKEYNHTPPLSFSGRSVLIERYKDLEKILSYTKKIKDQDEFNAVWLAEPTVKECRLLMREIWGFENQNKIVEEYEVCDSCAGRNPIKVFKYYIDAKFEDTKMLCQACLKKCQDVSNRSIEQGYLQGDRYVAFDKDEYVTYNQVRLEQFKYQFDLKVTAKLQANFDKKLYKEVLQYANDHLDELTDDQTTTVWDMLQGIEKRTPNFAEETIEEKTRYTTTGNVF